LFGIFSCRFCRSFQVVSFEHTQKHVRPKIFEAQVQGLEGFKGKVPAVANFGLFPAGGMGNMGDLTYEIYTVLPSSFSHGIQPAR
jgi:hypothetical protein